MLKGWIDHSKDAVLVYFISFKALFWSLTKG